MSDLRIRRYEPRDGEAVRELHRAALRETGADAGPGPWDDDLLDVEGAYILSGGEFLVGESGGRIVAIGALRRTSAERAEVKRMRVAPSLQGRGFGSMMLTALERRARELGCRELHLDTTSAQEAAMRLYEQRGYREVRRGEWRGLEMIYYEKRLPLPDNGLDRDRSGR